MRIARSGPMALAVPWAIALVVQLSDGSPVLRGQVERGSVAGRVVEAGNQRPVASARVEVRTAHGALAGQALTTAEGTYAVVGIPPGLYTIRVSRAGYAPGAFGRAGRTDPDRPIDLSAAEHLPGIDIPLCRYASVTGTIMDEHGDPLVGVTVQALRAGDPGGRYAAAAEAVTDDRGHYRLGALNDGEYLLLVRSALTTFPIELEHYGSTGRLPSVGGRRLMHTNALPIQIAGEAAVPRIYPPTYFRNARRSSDALPVHLACGGEWSGADIAMRPVPAAGISGTITTPDGPAALVPVRLTHASDELVNQIGFEVAYTVTGSDGRFRFEGVAAGDYVLRVLHYQALADPLLARELATGFLMEPLEQLRRALTSRPIAPRPTPTWFGERPVAVHDEDVTGVDVRLAPSARVSGSVTFAGDTPAPDLASVRVAVALEPADGRITYAAMPGTVTSVGTFTTYGSPPGRYLVGVRGDVPGWTVASAMLDGRDRLDHPIDLDTEDVRGLVVTFTDRMSSLTGMVRTEGRPDPEATVLVFPADRSLWSQASPSARRFATARTTHRGTYVLTTLPAGEYLVVAVPDGEVANWRAPDRLATLAARATRQRLSTGDRAHLDLTIHTLRRPDRRGPPRAADGRHQDPPVRHRWPVIGDWLTPCPRCAGRSPVP